MHIDELNSKNNNFVEYTMHDRPPSPVYRNGTEYSPPPSELGEERSPSSTNIKSPTDLPQPPPLERSPTASIDQEQQQQLGDENTIPAFSSGRRKGRPKKLVRDGEEGEEIISEETTEKVEEKQETNSSESHPDILPVKPNQLLESDENKEKNLEEYPVMIIKETTEEKALRVPVRIYDVRYSYRPENDDIF